MELFIPMYYPLYIITCLIMKYLLTLILTSITLSLSAQNANVNTDGGFVVPVKLLKPSPYQG